MATDRQSVVLPFALDGCRHAFDDREVGCREHPSALGVACDSRQGLSETYPPFSLFRKSHHRAPSKSLQGTDFQPAESVCGPPPLARMLPTPPDDGAKHLCGIAGDREEGENRTSRQAYSGRPARIVTGLVPEASNRPASPQHGGVGFQRPNQSSVCQSREQRHTGPRTPLHVNEGRPRARYDKKEHIKCSQVEYDSC